MKKALLLLLCLLPLLAGSGGLRAQRSEIERLRLVETMGLDPGPEGVLLTLAAPSGGGGDAPLCYSAPGVTVSEAMARLRDRSLEDTLFCGHLQHLLLGEALAREGLDSFLAYVCRSSDVRLDLPVYLLLDTSAREAMTKTGSGGKGVVDALEALGPPRENGPRPSSAGTILRDLESRDSALVRALRLQPNAEEEDAPGYIAAPAGYGVLIGGKLRETLSLEDGVAAELLTGTLEPCSLALELPGNRKASLELEEGGIRLRPGWDQEGRLDRLEIDLRVRAVVLELDGFDRLSDESVRDLLNARLEAELSRRVGNVLQLSRSLEADFLGLGSRIELQAPRRGRDLGRTLGPLLPKLEISVSVQGELSHNNDMN